jgi:AcrR family transcriptional regulator
MKSPNPTAIQLIEFAVTNNMDNDTDHLPDLHDEILKAALKQFAAAGYFNTSLADIAETAGVNGISELYRCFKSKQMIAAALHDSILGSLNQSIEDIHYRLNKPSEQLHGIVDLFFGLAEAAPDVMRFLLLIKVNEFLPTSTPLMETAPFTKILKIIQAGIKSGEIRNIDPKLGYAYFFGIITTTLELTLTGVLDKNIEIYQSTAWLTAWHTIAKKPALNSGALAGESPM